MASQKLNEDWLDKIAEKVYSFVTNQKRDALYHMAKSDPKLKGMLDDMEQSFSDLEKYNKEMEKYLKKNVKKK